MSNQTTRMLRERERPGCMQHHDWWALNFDQWWSPIDTYRNGHAYLLVKRRLIKWWWHKQQNTCMLVMLPRVCTWQTEMPVCWIAASVGQGSPSHSAKHTALPGVVGQYQICFHCLKDLSLPAKKQEKKIKKACQMYHVFPGIKSKLQLRLYSVVISKLILLITNTVIV